MKLKYKIWFLVALLAFVCNTLVRAQDTAKVESSSEKSAWNVRDFILEHVSDAYEWHITTWNKRQISIPLPVIIYSKTAGWNVFMSNKFKEQSVYRGFTIAGEGKYKGKIVELKENGESARPFDVSITKVTLSLIINSLLLIVIIMTTARSYKKHGFGAKKGFVGFMEMFIMNINDEVIKPCVGNDYRRYSPYLLTVFFFVFLNNIMGTLPMFPGGGNVTGNITITFVLAIITFLIVNISGTKEYWKEIFWPEVPTWLKAPVPLIPVIEVVGMFTKPFALMIRLFANMIAGHSITLGLVTLIFVTVSLGPAMNAGMSAVSILLSVFIGLLELLVAFLQAYIFTMLSAVFIGLARVKPHRK
ncbi:MAG: F0F1 ATP synthase subunit A [Paludibacter sp.]|nr:F0F1 ATP synthase subunit A [Paludibacter sp.]